MSVQRLTAFEQAAVAGLADRAALAARVLEAWGQLPVDTQQTARSLVGVSQLAVTDERATAEMLRRLCSLGMATQHPGETFLAVPDVHFRFARLAFALNAIDYYRSEVHQDATIARVVLTKPARPSVLEQKLASLGWRTADIEPTEHAFHALVRSARSRVVVMTPFFDPKGATWLREILSFVAPGVERVLVLRSLEDPNRKDYPTGFEYLAPWLKAEAVKVFNYSLTRASGGRETFHAKAVLCDRMAAYLGSSNLNAASLEHSMEMGVLLQGKAAAGVADVVDAVLKAAQPWP